jgi:hypothetical protein
LEDIFLYIISLANHTGLHYIDWLTRKIDSAAQEKKGSDEFSACLPLKAG